MRTKKWHFLIFHVVATSLSDKLLWAKASPQEVPPVEFGIPVWISEVLHRGRRCWVVPPRVRVQQVELCPCCPELPPFLPAQCHLLTWWNWEEGAVMDKGLFSRKTSLLLAKVCTISWRGRFLPGECKMRSGLWMTPWWFLQWCFTSSSAEIPAGRAQLCSLSLQEGDTSRVSELLLCPGWQVSWNNLLLALMLPEHPGRAAVPSTKMFLGFQSWVRPWTPQIQTEARSLSQTAVECFVCITC